MKDHHPTDLDERSGMMQTAVKTKKPRKQAVSGRFWAERTYRGRIKDDHKIDFACGTGGFLTSWLKELEKEVKTTEDREAFGRSIYGIEKKQFPYMLCITNMLLHDLDVPQVFHEIGRASCRERV